VSSHLEIWGKCLQGVVTGQPENLIFDDCQRLLRIISGGWFAIMMRGCFNWNTHRGFDAQCKKKQVKKEQFPEA